MHCKAAPGNERREFGVSASRCLVNQDYALAPRSDLLRRICQPAPVFEAVEVTLICRHRRTTYLMKGRDIPWARASNIGRRLRYGLANMAGVIPREQTKTGRSRRVACQSMNLYSPPLGLLSVTIAGTNQCCRSRLHSAQCACALRRRQTPVGYWKLRNHARRLTQTLSGPCSLRIEICVVYFIGRFSYASDTLP
jgi:hypothetical protein